MAKPNKIINEKEILAYEYVLGLIDKASVEKFAQDLEFKAFVQYWQDKTEAFYHYAPLDSKTKRKIWRNIKHQLPKQHPNIIRHFLYHLQNVLSRWQYILPSLVFIVAIFWVYQPDTQTLEWRIKTQLATQKLHIVATTHQHNNPQKSCSLWAKKNGVYVFITYLPETGSRVVKLKPTLIEKIQQAEMVISSENIMPSKQKNKTPTKPSIIEYQGDWHL